MGSSKTWAIDVESNGSDLHAPEFKCVGLGLANETTCFYIHLETLPADTTEWLKQWLTTVELTAFNVAFDGMALQSFTGKWLNWFGCSYVLFRSMATEGYPGQKWGLKFAMTEVLGWPDKNDFELRKWLVENGYTKRRIPEQILRKLRGEMPLAESDKLHPRNGEDSDLQLMEGDETTLPQSE